MTFDYGPIASIAVTQVADKGQSITLTRNTPGTFNPATGAVTGDSTATETVSAVVSDFRADQIDGSTIQRGDKQLLMTDAPNLDDSVTIDSLEYQIVDINTISPGGTDVLYKVQVRR